MCMFYLGAGSWTVIVDPELEGCANFGPEMVHLPQTIFFC